MNLSTLMSLIAGTAAIIMGSLLSVWTIVYIPMWMAAQWFILSVLLIVIGGSAIGFSYYLYDREPDPVIESDSING